MSTVVEKSYLEYCAFDLFSIRGISINKSKTISAISVWGNTLYVAINGRLLVYKLSYDRTSQAKFVAKHENEFKNIGKKFSQLCAVPRAGLLLMLCDGIIRIATLSSLKQLGQIRDQKDRVLKNILAFALKKRGKGYKLAVIMKNKKIAYVLDFKFKSMTFFVQYEISLTDYPKCVCWCMDHLFVGFSKEYHLINVSKRKTENVVKVPNSQQTCIALSLQKESLLKLNDRALTYDYIDGRPSRRTSIDFEEDPVQIAYLQPYLIASFNNFIEVKLLDQKERVDKEVRVQRLSIPGVRHHSQPNFIDFDNQLLDHGIGIGYKSNLGELQDKIYPEFRIFLATKSDVNVLCMRKFPLQLKEIQKEKKFREALHLAKILEGSAYQIPKERVDEIHVDYGFHLFVKRAYQKAMEHFAETNQDPRLILSLYGVFENTFPIPFGTLEERESAVKQLHDAEHRQNALTALIQYLLTKRMQTEDGDYNRWIEAVDTALLKALVLTDHNDLMTFIKKIPNVCSVPQTERNLTESKKFNELIAFYRSKELHHQALDLLQQFGMSVHPSTKEFKDLQGVTRTIVYLRDLGDRDLILKYCKWTVREDHLASVDIFTDTKCPFKLSEVLRVLERSYSSPSSSHHHGGVDSPVVDSGVDSEDRLSPHHHQRRRRTVSERRRERERRHRQIMILEMKIKFLNHLIKVRVNKDPLIHNKLILMYITHIRLCEQQMHEVHLIMERRRKREMRSYKSPLMHDDDDDDNQHLDDHDEFMNNEEDEGQVDELGINLDDDDDDDRKNISNNRKQGEEDDLDDELEEEEDDEFMDPKNMERVKFSMLQMKKELRGFLKSSQFYVASQILTELTRFPDSDHNNNSMAKERAILLSRLNRHEEALDIYIHKMRDQRAAEKYCRRNYDMSDPEKRDIFLLLLKINLRNIKNDDDDDDESSSEEHDEHEHDETKKRRRIKRRKRRNQKRMDDHRDEELEIDDSIKMMEKYFDRMDVIKVIKMLPDHITLKRLQSYFVNSLRSHLKKSRNVKVLRSLAYSHLMQTQYKVSLEKMKSFTVRNSDICARCKRRIGTSAFTVFKNKLCHYRCSKFIQVEEEIKF